MTLRSRIARLHDILFGEGNGKSENVLQNGVARTGHEIRLVSMSRENVRG